MGVGTAVSPRLLLLLLSLSPLSPPSSSKGSVLYFDMGIRTGNLR